MNLGELVGPVENLHPILTRKAILWGQESFLADSVEHFLKTGAAWDVVKISSESGIDVFNPTGEVYKPSNHHSLPGNGYQR